jgi:broad specificity phosphatase PhoE
MVRVLLVRHGESLANRRDFEVTALTAQAGVTRQRAEELAPSMRSLEANGGASRGPCSHLPAGRPVSLGIIRVE